MVAFFGPTDNWSWDPSFYYAHIRSPVVEHDLDFRNETVTGSVDLGSTQTGLQNSEWPIGPSLLWSPFFLAAHGLMVTIDPDHADGFSFPYIALVSLGSMAYGALGLLIIYRLCRMFAGRSLALAVTGLCLGATPLCFYLFRQPLMAHTTGLFAAAAMVHLYLSLSSEPDLSARSGLLFGVALGLCFLTRWNGLLMAAVPAVYFAGLLLPTLMRRATRDAWPVVRQLGIMLGVFVLTIAPQLALWYRLHGSLLAMPQSRAAFVASLLPVNLPNLFLNTNRGLIYWCPFALVGMVGLGLIAHRQLRLIAILITLGQVVLIGYRVDWYSGGGFGARYFIELLPFLAIGIVALAAKLPAKGPWKALAGAGGVALVLHQVVLMHSVEHAIEGWVDAASYVHGQPLGVRWQLDALIELLRDPGLLATPRPAVGVDRQTLLTNMLAGVHDPSAYFITGTALAMLPLVALLLTAVWRVSRRRGLEPGLLVVSIYFAMWAVFLLTVG